MRLLGVLGSALALGLGLTTPAWATRPTIETFTIAISGVEDCDGFKDVFAGEATVRQTTYVDAAGNPVTIRLHVSAFETDTNSLTGTTIEVRGAFTIVIDLVSGTFTETGLSLISNQPGQGAVIQDTGRVVFDSAGEIVFEAGPHDALDDPGIFCAALA